MVFYLFTSTIGMNVFHVKILMSFTYLFDIWLIWLSLLSHRFILGKFIQSLYYNYWNTLIHLRPIWVISY